MGTQITLPRAGRLLVALLGLMNTLIITVMERTREIGLSRAVGFTRNHISRMILIEAPDAAITELVKLLPQWGVSQESFVPLPDPRPKLRKPAPH